MHLSALKNDCKAKVQKIIVNLFSQITIYERTKLQLLI